MLSDEQARFLKGHLAEPVSTDDLICFGQMLLQEYEAANPPTPEVKCPACGGEMRCLDQSRLPSWGCVDIGCNLVGPRNDPTGSKVQSLGKRKLPLDKDHLYLIYKSGGRMFAGHMKYLLDSRYERLDEIDHIDISEWFNA